MKGNAEILLKKGKDESLRRGHPWIFSGAIGKIVGTAEEGDLVGVRTAEGEKIGLGHFQRGSIMVRMLHFGEETELAPDFWEKRIESALRLRKVLNLDRADNDTFRLIHGEGDLLPGLVVDRYGTSVIIQAHSVGMHRERMRIAQAIKTVLGDQVKTLYYKSETTLPYKAFEVENDYLSGSSETATHHATENGLKFFIDWEKGQKTGFFIDQRENRVLLERYARGRNVLNMFCYTGGFSCYAMRGGAKRVVSVDSSGKAIEIVKKNIAMNFGEDPRHEALTEDAFRYLNEMTDDYDLIVLDPPAFAKHRDVLKNALQGYRRLNAKAFEKIKPGGILFTFSCSQAVNKEQFRTAVFSAAAQSKRNVRILHQLTQPADHPINIYHPEGEYLKGLVVYVE